MTTSRQWIDALAVVGSCEAYSTDQILAVLKREFSERLHDDPELLTEHHLAEVKDKDEWAAEHDFLMEALRRMLEGLDPTMGHDAVLLEEEWQRAVNAHVLIDDVQAFERMAASTVLVNLMWQIVRARAALLGACT